MTHFRKDQLFPVYHPLERLYNSTMFNSTPIRGEKIMVNVRALVCLAVGLAVMLWAGTGQAALVYLDANFASDTVAQDSTGLNIIEPLTATSSGVIWGGKRAGTEIYRVTSGVYESFPFAIPGGVGAVRMQNDSTVLVGSWYNFAGTPTDSAAIYKVDTSGVVTPFITMPFDVSYVHRLAVSPINGDILVRAEERMLKYDSSGVLQWNVPAAPAVASAINYSPSGDAYAAVENGGVGDTASFYSINSDTGEMTLLPVSVPISIPVESGGGGGGGFVHDMVFSSSENIYTAITSNNNHIEIYRTNINTNVSDLLAHWDFEVPLTERWLEYVDGQGLYLNSFDASELELPSELQTFGMSFSLESSTASVLLLSGDFNGSFSGLNALDTLAPEPSSVWLLLGLGLAWKRKLGNRHSPPAKDSR